MLLIKYYPINLVLGALLTTLMGNVLTEGVGKVLDIYKITRGEINEKRI